LDKLILLNYEGFLKIAKKHDKWIRISTRPWMLARLSTAAFLHERFDRIVSGLSDVYTILRLRLHPEEEGVWEPPAEFKRKTTKYWINPSDVLHVKCAMVKHFPVLIFGRKLSISDARDGEQPSDSSLITSVYLDNTALDIYHTRIDRVDGATLFRFRWYGQCSGQEHQVFVERKTHRGPEKKKAGLASMKERFAVRWADIPALLNGTLDVQARVAAPLQAANTSDEEVAYAVQLASDCQAEIVARGLQPVTTTIYYRTSFQLNSCNTVRSTMDCQLRMMDEERTRGGLAPGEWWRPLSGEHLKPVHEFPFSVLEFKLQGPAPEWVKALIDSGKITPCVKFSKYLHSIVALGHPVQKPPHWLGENHSFVLHPSTEAAISSDSSNCESTPPPISGPSVPPSVTSAGPSTPPASVLAGGEGKSRAVLLSKVAGMSDFSSSGGPSSTSSERGGGSTDGAPGSTPIPSGPSSSDEDKKKKGKGKDKKGDKKDKKEKEKESPPPPPPPPPPRKEKERKEREEPRSERDDEKETPRVKTLVRKRVDPKTLFANERTMLQWLNMAVLLVFTSLALLATSTVITNTGGTSSDVKAMASGAQLCGAILAPAAILVMLYAMWQYYWRISRITDPDEDARFEDKFGPLVLVFMIIVVCSVAIGISVNRFNWSHFIHPGSASAPAKVAAQSSDHHQQQQQEGGGNQGVQFSGPKSSVMLMQAGVQPGMHLAVVSWAVAGLCVCIFATMVVASRAPLFVAYRRHVWRQLRGEHAGQLSEEEDYGLLASCKYEAALNREQQGAAAGSYGTGEVSASLAYKPPPLEAHVVDVVEAAPSPRAEADAAAEQLRWEQLCAINLPTDRVRLHTSVPICVA
jgi:SPX domain protein involved in polyphosphate accumulation/uncharacterized membrane protein YidH (DUF202 family)